MENTEQSQNKTSVDTNQSISISNEMNAIVGSWELLVIFLLNMIAMFTVVVCHSSVQAWVGFILTQTTLAYVMFQRQSQLQEIAGHLPSMFFADLFITLVIFLNYWKSNWEWDAVGSFWGSIGFITLLLLVLGAVLGFISLQKDRFYFLSWIGAELVGGAVIAQLWGDGSLDLAEWDNGGKEILYLFILGAMLWYFVTQLALISVSVKKSVFTRLGFIVLIVTIFLFIGEKNYIDEHIQCVFDFYRNCVHTWFAWWKILLVAILLFSFSMFMDGYNRKVCYMLASGVLMIKLLLVNYTPFTGLFVFLFICYNLFFLRYCHLVLEKKQINEVGEWMIWIQPILWIVCTLGVKKGLWINLILTIILLIFYFQYYFSTKQIYQKVIYFVILIGIAAEGIAWIWALQYHVDKIIMILVALVVAIVTMLILEIPHPNKQGATSVHKIAVCLLFLLVCLTSLNRYGSKIKVRVDEDRQQIEVTIKVKGRENSIESVQYIWSDQYGQEIGSDFSTKKAEEEIILIQAEALKICVTDQNGVKSTQYLWFPNWVLSENN